MIEYPETADIETSSDDYARRFGGAVGNWFLKVQEDATLRMLSSYPGCRILDVGGGHGQLTEGLVRGGFKVTVLGSTDACSFRIRNWVERGLCSFQTGNLLDLPFAGESFDVVISYRLVAHVKNWRRFLAEMARVSRQAVFVDYPPVRSLNFTSPFMFQWKKRIEGNARPFQCFKESDLLDVFRATGFAPSDRYPQFTVPMVIHRMMGSAALSASMERAFRLIGLTRWFGSPVILKVSRENG